VWKSREDTPLAAEAPACKYLSFILCNQKLHKFHCSDFDHCNKNDHCRFWHIMAKDLLHLIKNVFYANPSAFPNSNLNTSPNSNPNPNPEAQLCFRTTKWRHFSIKCNDTCLCNSLKRFSAVWPIQWNKQARFSDDFAMLSLISLCVTAALVCRIFRAADDVIQKFRHVSRNIIKLNCCVKVKK